MILVTGCAGFIGARICEMLLDDGQSVVGIDNGANASPIKSWRLDRLRKHSKFIFYPEDVCSPIAMTNIVWNHHPEAVIHCAAETGVRASFDNPSGYFKVNTLGTLNLLEFCKQHRVKKFVLASTSSVYGDSPLPFCEHLPANQPLSPYAASKKSAELFAHVYHASHGLDVSILRYFTVYGPAGRPDMSVWRFTEQIERGEPVTIYGCGEQWRDYTYVDDIALGTISALKPLGYSIINLGAQNPVRVLDLIALLESMLGKHATLDLRPSAPGDAFATQAEITRAKHVLGWTPQVPLADGVRRFVEWYRDYVLQG